MYGSFFSEDYLVHYGKSKRDGAKVGSGRYPLGSGEHPRAASANSSNNDDVEKGMTMVTAFLLARGALALATITAVAAAGAIKKALMKSDDKKAEEVRQSSPVDKKTGFHLKQKEVSPEEDMNEINRAYYYESDEGYKSNCMLCTTAFDLRRRGYDVVAKAATTGYQTKTIKDWYPKAKIETVSDVTEKGHTQEALYKNTIESLKSQGDGARGNLCVNWRMAYGGHSMAYEVQNGKVTVYDCQVGTKYSERQLKDLLYQTSKVEYARLDNVDFNVKNVKKECCR